MNTTVLHVVGRVLTNINTSISQSVKMKRTAAYATGERTSQEEPLTTTA